MTDFDRFNKFVSIMQSHYPEMQVRYKDESFLMRAIGTILFFNKAFMTQYATTIGNNIYLPSRSIVEKDAVTWMLVTAHECVHVKDSRKFTMPLFGFMYMAPLLLALLCPIATFFIGWWSLFFLLFLLPLPSPGRMFLEKRGYNMTLFAMDYRYTELGVQKSDRRILIKELAQSIDRDFFKGAAYYFMWPFGMQWAFDKTRKAIDSGDILDTDEVFRQVKAALDSSKR